MRNIYFPVLYLLISVLIYHNSLISMHNFRIANRFTKDDKSLAHLCKYGNSDQETNEAITIITTKKISPDYVHYFGKNFLHCVALNNHVFNISIADALVKHGVDVNAKNFRGWTPLFYLCLQSHDSMCEGIKFLLKNNAKVNCKDKNGNTPLHIAVDDSNEDSALTVQKVRLLLAYNADVHAKNNNGQSPYEKSTIVKTECNLSHGHFV